MKDQSALSPANLFAQDARGSVTIIMGVSFAVIFGLAAVAADHLMWVDQKAQLQGTADAAALAGARHYAENGSAKEATQVATAYLTSNKVKKGDVTVKVDEASGIVEAAVTKMGRQYLSGVIGRRDIPLTVLAQAQAMPSARPCIIALDPKAPVGIDFSLAGSVEAHDCAIWSNSESASSFDVNGSGTAFSSQNCAVGGISGTNFAITPTPQARCTPAFDPLEDWAPPAVYTCDSFSQERFNSGSITLSPGVYCGGLKVAGSSTVTLMPGVYVMKDGPLSVTSSASLEGEGVTIIFMGTGASASFLGSSRVRLSAATTGATEGLVLAAGRDQPTVSSIVGGGAQLDVEGTVYLPTHDLSYGGNSSTEIPATYSLLIARSIRFHGGSNVVVRGDPELSKVPPKVARTLGVIRLIR